MSRMVQIRNVPDEIHRKLKARAALAGLSLSDFILNELERSLERPTLAELAARLSSRSPVKTKLAPATVLRAERDRR